MGKIRLILLALLLAHLGSFFLSWQPEPQTAKRELRQGQSSYLEQQGSRLRSRFVVTYSEVLPFSEAKLLSGVVLGGVDLDRGFKNKLAQVGVTHIIAASGMNITLFSGFMFWALTLFRLRRIYKVVLCLIFMLLYCSVTGFESPVVRAAVMAAGTYLAVIVGRQASAGWGLIWAAYFMLWVDPTLILSASFLLSFSAMIGQIFLGSFVGDLLVWEKGRSILILTGIAFYDFVRRDFWQSFLAVVFTAPIVFSFFGKFSLVSLISNMLVVWTVEPLMILGGLIGLSGLVSVELARLLALPAGPLLAYFLWVVDLLSKDYFLANFKVTSWTFPVGYYLLLGGFVWWWLSSRSKFQGLK